jgi:putative sugar O-methyltransferase
MLNRLWAAICFLGACHLVQAMQTEDMESITGSDGTYLYMCQQAVKDPFYFQNFRSLPEYTHAVEIFNGAEFAQYIKKASGRLSPYLDKMRELDTIGNPIKYQYDEIGPFSATTMRYIAVADHIRQLFELPRCPKIAEIGGGFGGQCYILSILNGFSQYFIYDLPIVGMLIEKSLDTLSVPFARCMEPTSELPVEKIDLLISNYAFSECSRETQLDYFERVIKKADRGYVIYNQISMPFFGIDSLTPREFYELLDDAGMNPQVYEELISTHVDNILFVWDRTKNND